ncbi:hydrolase [Streptomyces paludis]|uniref:Hydrolase n=1 Tax=Streptomyces paludis TaxID=2282738 RepID=A0A345HU47_9ACTN|nr:hydrolase [Streptomyces paludis]AXG80221.1 hydrolase [Streptomyces paludis]
MSLWTSLEPASAMVDPGGTTTVRLRLRNTGDVVDEYRFTPVGDLAPFIRVEPPALRLFPGTTGAVELTIAPPRSPDATAGPNPYGVRIVPTEYPEAAVVPEGNVTITAFTELRAELVPPTVKGRFRGRPRLAIDNLGNTKITASLSGSDNGDQLSYEINPANVQIEPGRAAFVDATLRPRETTWFGRKQQRPYTLGVQRSGEPRLDVEGTFVQRGVMPRWLATVLAGVVALAVGFVVLWIAHNPQVRSLAQPRTQSVAASALPSEPLESAPAAPAPPSEPAAPPVVESVPPPPSPSAVEKQSDGDGGDKEKKEKEKETEKSAEPQENTAAVAVNKLNAERPGRHICYRVYTSGAWQNPVCDGEMAGTTDQALPVEGINIAVSGIGVVGANGYLRDSGWEPEWKHADNGIDLYVGTVGQAKHLGVLVADVTAGSICITAHVHDEGWQETACSQPGGYISRGSESNALWLEAIRLTV